MTGSIKISYSDRLAIITLPEGEKRLNIQFVTEFLNALDEVESHPEVNALITTAEGHIYGAGLDLDWAADQYKAGNIDAIKKLYTLFDQIRIRLMTYPLPTVAAINGHAVAGGAFIALCHDVRVMRDDRGFFWINEVHLGMVMKGTSMEILRARLTPTTLNHGLILGKRCTPQQALSYGCVHHICAADRLVDKAKIVAQEIIKLRPLPRDVLRQTKEAAYSSVLTMHKNTHYQDSDVGNFVSFRDSQITKKKSKV